MTVEEQFNQFVEIKQLGNKMGLTDLQIGKLPIYTFNSMKTDLIETKMKFQIVKLSDGRGNGFCVLLEDESNNLKIVK